MEVIYAMGIKDAAKSIGLSPWTLRKWVADGKIEFTKVGRRVLIEPRTLQELLERGRQHAQAAKLERRAA